MFILVLAVPLPNFVLDNLSAQLQLWSTQLGVAMIRLFDISVYAEGNVIDIGSMKLQVVEACNGLRYLLPLMTLALVCAHFFHAALPAANNGKFLTFLDRSEDFGYAILRIVDGNRFHGLAVLELAASIVGPVGRNSPAYCAGCVESDERAAGYGWRLTRPTALKK